MLAIPAGLLILWMWQLWKRRADAQAFMRRRQVPVNERIPYFGELFFWLFLIFAAGAALLALAKPQAVTSLVRTAGADIIILQDGSASMHVSDVAAIAGSGRCGSSARLVKPCGGTTIASRWRCCAHMATPQIRLTKDPNTYFFFLDHLEDRSPYRFEDDGTWDTNIEWDLLGPAADKKQGAPPRERLEKKPGAVSNPRSFVLISDGQSWSGEVAKSLALAQERGVPLNVVRHSGAPRAD